MPGARLAAVALVALVASIAAPHSAAKARKVTANGLSFAYIEQGSGPPLVLVHGSVSDYREWDLQMRPLAKHYRVIAYSRRYHWPNVGPGPTADASVDRQVEDLAAIIRALGIAPAHIVAHSFGGAVALELALRHPEMVRSLVLEEPGVRSVLGELPDSPTSKASQAVRAEMKEAFATNDPDRIVRTYAARVAPGEFEKAPRNFREMLVANVAAFQLDYNARRSPFSCADAQRIKAPALVVCGGRSPLQRIAEKTAECLTGAKFVRIAGATHWMQHDHAREFNDAVLSFLAAVHDDERTEPRAALTQTNIKSEFVRLKTGDGLTLHGALWTPASGKARVGIIIAPGGGSEFYSDWLVWLGENFARSGYIALSMNRRDHGHEQWYQDFEPSAMDHRYMVDLLASRGAQAVILVGHSYGTVTAPYYVMASDDPRVKAIVLYGPHGYKRDGLARSFGSRDEYEHAIAKAREMVAAGLGKDTFLLPPILPGGQPRPSSYETFLNRGGPDTEAVPVEIIAKVQGRPILAIRDPADPFPATIPPAQQQLQEANRNLEYILLPDIRDGTMDPAAHQFRGREVEVFRITLAWLEKHKLSP
jgi:non-heme chloroperoxidase